MKLEKINKIIYTIIFTSITMLVFVMFINQQNISFYSDNSSLYKFAMEIYLSLKVFDVAYVALFAFIYYFYYHIYFDGNKLNLRSLFNICLAILLTFIVMTGKAYKLDNTLGLIFNTKAQMVKCGLLSIGYYLIFYAVLKKLSLLKLDKFFKRNDIKKKNKYLEKVINFYEKYHVIISIIIILLGWLPYVIIYYPGASTGDTFDSLCQFFHREESWSIDTITLLNEDVYINKHHSVFFTVILGLIFKLGKFISSFTVGAFIYTVLQILLLLILFGFMFHYMKKLKTPLWIRLLSVLFLAFTPACGAYAISAIKDTPSAIFTMIYVIFLVQIVRNYDSIFKNKFRLICLMIVMLLVILLRNNGIFTILLSFPFLLIIYKKKWKKIIMSLSVVLVIFFAYDKILLPSLDVTDGSIKEALTIPFMQVGRVVYFNHEQISEEDREKIDKVLDYEVVKYYYDPDLADSVKDSYRKNATKGELKEFFGVWFKLFKKYPLVYIESVINSTYGYFFPEAGEDYAVLAVDSRVGRDTYFNILSVDKYKENRMTSVRFNQILTMVPFLFFFNHAAFFDWFLIFSCIFIIRRGKYKYLIPLCPLLSVLLVCIASPVNGSFRYILPIIFSIPVMAMINYLAHKEGKY